MTRTTTIARTLKGQVALLALAACLVAPTTEATASTSPDSGIIQQGRPETGVIVQSGIIVQSGVIAQTGIIVTGAGQRQRPESGILQQRQA